MFLKTAIPLALLLIVAGQQGLKVPAFSAPSKTEAPSTPEQTVLLREGIALFEQRRVRRGVSQVRSSAPGESGQHDGHVRAGPGAPREEGIPGGDRPCGAVHAVRGRSGVARPMLRPDRQYAGCGAGAAASGRGLREGDRVRPGRVAPLQHGRHAGAEPVRRGRSQGHTQDRRAAGTGARRDAHDARPALCDGRSQEPRDSGPQPLSHPRARESAHAGRVPVVVSSAGRQHSPRHKEPTGQ